MLIKILHMASGLAVVLLFALRASLLWRDRPLSPGLARFFKIVPHIFYTTLVVFGLLLLMRLPGPLTPDQEKQLGLVQSSGKHLLSLINDLLDLAKIESGRVELRLDAIGCAPVLEEVLQTLGPAARARGLWLRLEPRPDWPAVRADRRALLQILINLTGNAVKFTQTGGVTLTVRDVDDGVAFEVRDTGPGISVADRARLFEAFTQVGDARSRSTEGTGLGLHLSTKLAALMQGRIEVDSEPGHGSCFTLTLGRS